MTKKQHSPLVAAYAQSLLELAFEQGQAEAIGAELAQIGEALAGDERIQLFLESPNIGAEQRMQVLEKALGDVSPLLRNFLRVLNRRGMSGKLAQIIEAFDEMLDERLGKVEVDVTVAIRLSPEELEDVRRRISTALGKDAVVHQYVDDSIIGGMILRVGDRIIDPSVRHQLEAMRRKLLNAAGK
jgi:F-type H+-transporting ATPase subunit delta